MTDEQRMVIQFFNCFQVEVKNKPELPDTETLKLRAKLIMEESLETIKGLGIDVIFCGNNILIQMRNLKFEVSKDPPNLIAIADGMADSHYVNYCGTGAACGLDMQSIFAEVHRSNMTKLWLESELLVMPNRKGWTKTKLSNGSERCWLVRNPDGKVTKSPSYSPANIAAEIKKQIDRQP